MTGQLKTPLDLELNLFENSFASRDLFHAHGARNSSDSPAPDVSARSVAASLVSHNLLLMEGSSGQTDSSEMLEMKPRTAIPLASLQRSGGLQGAQNYEAAGAPVSSGLTGSNNKHNLRLLNFGSVNNDRSPGLTPPVSTPGGRRLPPIHILPDITVGSPGTPGSNMWSSLLTATNGVGTVPTGEQTPGLYQPPNYLLYMRKSALIQAESTLRSGLTPVLAGANGFNFNPLDSMTNGQMTPGLQALLGLVNINHGEQQSPPVPASTRPGNIPAPMLQHGSVSGPLQPSIDSTEIRHAQQPRVVKLENVSHIEPAPAKQTTSKNAKTWAHKNDGSSAAKVQKTSRTSQPPKANPELEEEKADVKNEDDSLDEEEKRKQFLERNRIAALKCRQRKKQLFSKMESELAFYSDGYHDLTAQNARLRDQIMTLGGLLVSHKDCPALLNSVGGYQQLQNVINQSEFLACGGNHPESGYVAMSSAAPNIVNNQQTAAKPPRSIVASGHGQMHLVAHEMHVHGGHTLTHGDSDADPQGRNHVQLGQDQAMGRLISLGNGQHPGAEPQNKDTLRPISSTSNLQHIKHGNDVADLRPIASMAELQPQNQNAGVIARQVQL